MVELTVVKIMLIAEGDWERRLTVMENEAVELEEGWSEMERALTKLKRIMEGAHEQFTSEEYMNLYSYPDFVSINFILFAFLRDDCLFLWRGKTSDQGFACNFLRHKFLIFLMFWIFFLYFTTLHSIIIFEIVGLLDAETEN